MGDGFRWTTETEPFEALDGSAALFVLEQVDDALFRSRQPFRYRRRQGPPIEVTDESLGLTDLASIPQFMSWFVSRQGRHTPAALVHDQLITPESDTKARTAADRTFREAMDAIAVPPVRSRVMWTAVALATRWRGGRSRQAGIVVWCAASIAGTALLIHGVRNRSAPEIAVALAAPVPAGVLWGRQYWAGVIAGYSIWFVVVPAVTSWVGYSPYWLVELAVRRGRKLLPQNWGKRLSTPVPFREA
jgi:Protein of unknown function (DUF1353)